MGVYEGHYVSRIFSEVLEPSKGSFQLCSQGARPGPGGFHPEDTAHLLFRWFKEQILSVLTEDLTTASPTPTPSASPGRKLLETSH